MANKDTKNSSSGLIMILFTLTFLTIGAVGYMFYQMNGNHTDTSLTSIFEGKKEEKIFPLEEFTLKLADGRYAKMTMSIAYMSSKDKDHEEYKLATPILRDKVNMEVMKMESYQLGVKHIDNTKKLLVEQLKPIIKKSDISNVYIETLVVQ